jgi:hypothetical protein
MALYGGLAENTRRNERVERGLITFTGTATIGFTASQTVNLSPAYGRVGGMRAMTHFWLQLDDGGAILSGIVGASTAQVTGALNAAGTILTLHANSFTSAANPTLIASTTACTVHYQIWGNLLGVAGETDIAGF